MDTLEVVLQGINNLGGQAALKDIYEETSRIAKEEITEAFRGRIRVCICRHSSDSDVFYQKGKHEDLFAFVGKGPKGNVWKLR